MEKSYIYTKHIQMNIFKIYKYKYKYVDWRFYTCDNIKAKYNYANNVAQETEAIKEHKIEWDENENELPFCSGMRKVHIKLHQKKMSESEKEKKFVIEIEREKKEKKVECEKNSWKVEWKNVAVVFGWANIVATLV